MEFILGLITAPFVWLSFLFFLIVISDATDSPGWAGFLSLATLGLIGWQFAIPWQTLLLYLAAYFPLGLLWSFWRYRNWVRKSIKGLITISPRLRESLSPSNNTGRIMTWIMAWPASVVSFLVGDFLADIARKLYDMCGNVYEKLFASAIADVPVEEPEKGRFGR